MIDIITDLIWLTNQRFGDRRRPCTQFKELFAGYFPESFLAKVITLSCRKCQYLPTNSWKPMA